MNDVFPESYVPTLAIRQCEMKALGSLPEDIKKLMTPCILLTPWGRSKSLNRAIERVEQAFPRGSYYLDLNRDFQCVNPDELAQKPAQREFIQLFDTANWIEFIKKNDRISPCIQYKGKNESEIRQHIREIQKLGRQYCIRIERGERFPNNFDEIVSALKAGGQADFTIILEGGWVKDALSLLTWFEGLITGALQEISAEVPIVASCTSIPIGYSDINGIETRQFHNRELLKLIQEKTNRSTLIYGDWGSTRPRKNNEDGWPGPPRIDYPTDNTWCIARNADEGWNFKRAAEEIINNSGVWSGNLDTLGETMIHRTATLGQKFGINSLKQNTTARVSIHLHQQALYGREDISTIDFDDDWED